MDAASVYERIDDLTRQLDRLARISEGRPLPAERRPDPPPAPPKPSAPPPRAGQPPLRAVQPAPGPEVDRYAGDRKLNGDPLRPNYAEPNLDQAVAEITARQRALQGRGPLVPPRRFENTAPAPQPPPSARHDAPAPDLSGLEDKLRTITSQIESLRPPSELEESLPALRKELAEISRSLSEAMPQRAIEAIEREIRALSQRLDQTRSAGGDGRVLAGIENGLAEVRDALHGLTPAENLVGFQSTIQSLARKVDAIAASQQDPSILQPLEAAVTGLRSIVSHVASDDTLARLTDEVRGLAAKVERVASQQNAPDALSNLEQRVGAIAEALDRRNGRGQQASEQIEAGIRDLAEKVERLQLSRGDTIAFGQLEDRITKLVEKLDSSGARLGHLEAIERGLADLMVHLENQRNRAAAAGRAADAPELDALKHNLANVNGALNRVVERLTTIEAGIRNGPHPAAVPVATAPPAPPAPVQPTPAPVARVSSPPPPAVPAAPVAAPALIAAPAPAASPAAKPMAPPSQRLAAAAAAQGRPPQPQNLKPIDPSLPPDHPIEPGAVGKPRPALSPMDRIAASEAALGPAKPPVIPDPGGGKSNFIAAARRAALAATRMSESLKPAADATPEESEKLPLRKRVAGRVRSLLVGVSIVVLAIGGFRVLTDLLQSPDMPPVQAPHSAAPAIEPMHAPATTQSTAIPGLPSAPEPAHQPPPAGAPANTAPATAAGRDVTGSIPPAPPSKPVSSPPAGDRPAEGLAEKDHGLIAAATAGNPAAAYELALRYLDGHGAHQSYSDAVHWLEPAAKHGLAPAQFRLATLYEKGHGVKKDLQAARRLYLAAAEKGNAKAMHNLAVLYAEGIDGKPNYTVAAQWFRRAADHGVMDSQYNLGVLCARGFGVEQNSAEAYKWFTLAALQGDRESARKRDDIASRLDAQSLMAAKLAAKTWVAQPQPAEATTVKVPTGGWDRTLITPTVKRVSAPPAKHKLRARTPLHIGPG